MGASIKKTDRVGKQVTKAQAQQVVKAHGLPWDDELEETWNRLAAAKAGDAAEEEAKVATGELVAGIDALLASRGGRTPLPAEGRKDDDGAPQCPFSGMVEPIPLVVRGGTHQVSQPTRELLEAIGGVDRLLAVTSRFYPKMFRDQHLVQFVTDQDEPHPQRLADWIAEKMSGTEYWSSKLQDRPRHQAYDRSSAHFRAWNSPHRDAASRGNHFKLDDSIMWMRLMFWSCREEGLGETPFFDWFVRFISHFVRVYERNAPPHAAAAAEWSADPANIQEYERSGYIMNDVVGLR